MPATSDAPVYDVFQKKPKSGSETVFMSNIAPTQELGSKLINKGGANQIIVPDRGQFRAAELIYSINDNI